VWHKGEVPRSLNKTIGFEQKSDQERQKTMKTVQKTSNFGRILSFCRPAGGALAALTSGTIFAAGCSDTAVRAVAAGISAAASSINNSRDEDISFADWVISELEDD